MGDGASQQREVPGFIHVNVVNSGYPSDTYRTRYVNPRYIVEFDHQYILLEAHSLEVRESLGAIARKIENAFNETEGRLP